MNLEESDSFKNEIEKNTRQRRTVMLSIVVCAMIAALLFVLIMILKYQDSITLKMFLDGKQISIPKGFYKDIDGKIYVDVKALGEKLGYTYTKGVYGQYNEDDDSCYLQNGFEVVAITAGAEKYTKYLEAIKGTKIADIPATTFEDNGYKESFSMVDAPAVFDENKKIYVCKDYLPEMFNMHIDWKEFRIRFTSFEQIVADAKKQVAKAEYTVYDGNYENLRAALYGFAIVGNDSKQFGVYSLTEGREIISLKYNQIEFVQNTQDFYITVADGTKGILSSEGKTIIAPSAYQDIKLLDEEQKLYIVEKDSEYGVLDKNGQVVIHAENDYIGYDTKKYTLIPIENSALLFNKCIPVEKDGKYGLYSTDGTVLLSMVNDAFGCITNASSQTSGNKQNVLLIPSEVGINGIVYSFNGYYGIYDVNEEEPVIPPACQSVYAITKGGETTYYFDYMDVTYDLKQYLLDRGLANVSTEETEEPSEEVPAEGETTEETPAATE